jgi:hypothetical protein
LGEKNRKKIEMNKLIEWESLGRLNNFAVGIMREDNNKVIAITWNLLLGGLVAYDTWR